MPDLATDHRRRHDEEYALCARDFWYFAQFLVDEDEEREIVRPYPLNFEYLHKYHKTILDHRHVVILKSRRMLITLHELAFKLWRAKFAGQGLPDAKDVYYGGYSAIDEDLAIYQFTRLKFMHEHLPDWLRLRNPLTVDNALYMKFQYGGKIKGFPLKRQGPQGFGFSDFTFDEMAWQEAARSTWKGLKPTIGIGSIRAISTPNGKDGIGRLFYEVWMNNNNSFKDMHRIKVHWSENPEHDEEWYRMMCAGMENWWIQQMLELSFISQAGTPVWANDPPGVGFDRQIHVAKEIPEIIANRPIYSMWDFGYHNPAFLFAQRNTRDQWIIHREYLKEDIDFDVFCKECRDFAAGIYDRRKHPEVHFVDPAGFSRYSNRAKSGASCDVHAIKLIWKQSGSDVIVYPGESQTGTRTNEAPRLKAVRKLWSVREGDGLAGAIISPACEHFIDGCGGGYCYPDNKGRGGSTEEPDKNSYSHDQDAFQYGVSGYNRINQSHAGEPDSAYDRQEAKRKRDRIRKMRTGV